MAKRTSTSMAQWDRERGVVRLAAPALDLALRLLSPGPFLEPHPPGLEPLVAAGLAIDPAAADHRSDPLPLRLTPWCADLLAVVAGAHFAAEVQVFIGMQAWRARLLVAEGGAALVVNDGGGGCTIEAVNPFDAADAVAAFVGFRREPRAATTATTPALDSEVIDAFHSHLTAGEGPAAARVLTRTGVSDAELDLLLALTEGRCSSWRVEVPGRSMVVVDGGHRGLWSRSAGTSGCRSTHPAQVWQQLECIVGGAPPQGVRLASTVAA